MESASVAAGAPAPKSSSDSSGGTGVEDKGLKKGAIGLVSSVVIGVASTAPGYSLAASLGLVAAAVGLQSPAIMIVAFLPMLFIAFGYFYMNRADPDCGTTFSWATKAFGPTTGWIGGWAIIVADVIVMANLAQIAGLYSFLLFGKDDPSTLSVTIIGVIWIVIMTAICVKGIELSARTQVFLLGAEVLALLAFAITALVKVYANNPAGSVHPTLDWFNPFAVSSSGALTAGVLVAVFIYWGWDSAVTVNEETEDSATAPGRSAVISTLILVLIYVVVSVAAQAYGGVDSLVANSDDVLSSLGKEVFGTPLDKILIIAVLTSAAASTQTTILPTARTSLSMARAHAMPKSLGAVHESFQTPHWSTIWMGTASIIWYVGLTLVSENILFDSIAALGLMIAFYYAMTGFACAWFYRRELTKSFWNFFSAGLMPTVGGLILTYVFIKSCSDLSDPANSESGDSWLGLGPPLIIGIGMLLFGFVLMYWQKSVDGRFWEQKAVLAPVGALQKPAEEVQAEVEPTGERE